MSNTISPETAMDWLAARKIISAALAEWFPRLAHAMLLVVHADRLDNGVAR